MWPVIHTRLPHLYLVGLTILLSCDTLKEDIVPSSELSNALPSPVGAVRAHPGQEIQIDLLQGVVASQNIGIRLDVLPTRGEAGLQDGGSLYYAPYPDFTFGQDQIVVTFSNRQAIRSDTIQITMLSDTVPTDSVPSDTTDQCVLRLTDDNALFYYDLPTNEDSVVSDTVMIDMLQNDQVCGRDSLIIRRLPSLGEAWIVGDQIAYLYTIASGDSLGTSLTYGYGPPYLPDSTDQATIYIKVTYE